MRRTANTAVFARHMRAIAFAALLLLLVASASYGARSRVAPSRVVGVSASATLNGGGHGSVSSVSCAAPGECSAGGYYRDAHLHYQAFVVSETNGSWGKAIKVPGLATLNTGAKASVESISCGAPGDCAAGGYYTVRRGGQQAFVVSETNGSWGNAIKVPGTATLNTAGFADVESISCPAAGDCAAGGVYAGRDEGAFVVSETNGTWGNATKVPGLAKLDVGDIAFVWSISCAAPGECAAGGEYSTDSHGNAQGFVVSETSGTWGKAIGVPDTYQVTSISCAAPGDCAAGGPGFLVSETNGSWGDAMDVPGIATLNGGGGGSVGSISCAAAGECAAGGWYGDSGNHQHAFVVEETNGSWGDAIEVPGTATLSSGYGAVVHSISCRDAGECAAGGFYHSSSGRQAFVVSEANGSWNDAIEVPATAALNPGGDAGVESISCAATGECVAGGFTNDYPYHGQRAFVAGETNGSWGNAIQVRLPSWCAVPRMVGKPLSTAKARLNAADCRLGKVTHAHSSLQSGRIVGQHPKAGTILRAGARVAVTVSSGS